jgi:hypothetical protein
MTSPVPDIDPTGTALGATIVTVLVTPALSLLVLWRFRRAVERSMRSVGGARDLQGRDLRQVAPLGGWVAPGPMSPRPPSATAVSRLRQAVGWYLAAGLTFALLTTALLLSLNGQELLLLRFALVTLVFAWPLVPTLALVCAWSWRGTALAVSGYIGTMLVLGLFSSGGVGGPLLLWLLYMVPPSLIVAAVALRRVRAVGPFLAPAVFVVGAGFMVWPWIAYAVAVAGASLEVATGSAIALIALMAAATLLVVPIAAWRYRRKASSDQSVLVDQWWLLFALSQCLFTPQLGWQALALLLPYFGYLVVVRVGRAQAHRSALRQRPRSLLLLRVFGARGRSERLLRQVNAYWRYVGSVELIAGTDLASAALEPHEFLEFIRGSLSRQFIGDEAELNQQLHELDRQPDRDGRFRINQFFCHANMWQRTVETLAGSADVILVDLRGLDAGNDGVAYELTMLARLGALGRTLGLVDATTNRDFLNWVLHRAGGPPPRTIDLDGRAVGPLELLRHLETAKILTP